MTSEEFKRLFKAAIEKKFKPSSEEKNDMKLKRKTQGDLRRAYKEHEHGLITSEELMDLEWYYFETWVEPINLHSSFSSEYGLDPIILN